MLYLLNNGRKINDETISNHYLIFSIMFPISCTFVLFLYLVSLYCIMPLCPTSCILCHTSCSLCFVSVPCILYPVSIIHCKLFRYKIYKKSYPRQYFVAWLGKNKIRKFWHLHPSPTPTLFPFYLSAFRSFINKLFNYIQSVPGLDKLRVSEKNLQV